MGEVLSIGKLSAGQERYYLDHAAERVDVVESVAGGAEDYYLDPAEARGRWLGAGAARLGLAGDVGDEPLRRVLAGLQPTTEEPLRQTNARLTVSGYDFTFSAPKSVSLLFGLGDDHVRDGARAAHGRAVAEAIAYIERTAASVRRGHGGATVAPADGLVAATFRHRTSRAADPQLHTHVVIANLGRGPDGRWSALDGRRLYAHARAASFLYQAVLRGELTSTLGVSWSEVTKGIAEIDGVPRELVRAFSTRRGEIEAALRDRGTEGARASEAAALATRRRKDRSLASIDLRANWRKQAAELGWGAREVSGLVGRSRGVELDPQYWERIVDELAGPNGLTRQRSSFDRRDVLQGLAERLPVGLHVKSRSLETLVERFLASPQVVPLVGETALDVTEAGFRRRDGRIVPLAQQEHRYSTVELLGIEQGLLDAVIQAQAMGVAIAEDHHVETAIANRSTLAAEQIAMVRSLCSGGEGVVVVAGHAGTGKTYALDTAREAWQANGSVVLGAAVARRAARELESGAGIASTSVHALLGRLQAGARLPSSCVLVIDEAGMLGTRQMAGLTHHVLSAGGKLVLVGDHRQLPELEAGGAFRALARDPSAIRLTENRRQVEGWERVAVDHLRAGRAEAAIELYEAHDRLAMFATPEAACEQLVTDWWSQGATEDSVMIAQRRLDVADLNRRARDQMRAAGRLGSDEVSVAGTRYAIGDRVVVKRNDLQRGVHNGDLGRVAGIDAERLRIAVEITGPSRIVVLESRFLLERTEHGQPSLAHGYAVTGHVAQGTTVREAFVLAGAGVSQEWAYAAMTRGREANRLYCAFDAGMDRGEYAPRDVHALNRDVRETLIAALETSEAQPLALDRGWPGRHRRTGIERSGRGAEIG